jgi:acyl dehydratase
MDRLYFEDFRPGEIVEYGDAPVTAEAIVAFARQFDPQPFHLGEEAARDSLAGGLIASGWRTAATLMRMSCDAFLNRAAAQGSPGIDKLDWLKPVRPGDRLRARRTTLSARPSRFRPAVGVVEFLFEVLNQNLEIVMTQKGAIFFLRRAAGEAPP